MCVRFRPPDARVLAAALLALTACPAPAQRAPGELPALVVSATRVPTPSEEVSSAVSVISAATIERKQYRSIGDALRSIPSLSVVRSGGPGKSTAVFSRGTDPNHTLLIVDGIEMNDPANPDGRIDLAHIAIEDVERIEVLHGPQGTLYGSDAVGAVISIVTKRGADDPAGHLTLEGGSFGTFNQSGQLRGRHGIVDGALGFQHLDSGGISALSEEFRQANGVLDDDASEHFTGTLRLGVEMAQWLSADFSGRYVYTRDELDLNEFPVSDDSDSLSRGRYYYLGANLRATLLDGVTEHRLGVAFTDVDRRTRDRPDPVNPFDSLADDNRGQRLKVDLQNDIYLVDGNVLTVGLETEEERARITFASTSLFGPFSSAANASVRTNAVYLQDQLSIAERLFGTFGVRLDDHSDFGSVLTWRVAGAYLHRSSGTKLRASYATGFKAPSLFQLFGVSVSLFGPFNGNPDLTPERSRGWEVGVEQALLGDRLRLGVTYFENDIENLIDFDPTFTTNINIAQVDTRGVEAFAALQLTPSLAARLQYALTRAEDARTGLDQLRRPLHKASADLEWQPIEPLVLTLEGILVGHRMDLDAATFARIERESYGLVNVAGRYRFGPRLDLFARVENLLDRDFEEPDGFAQPGIGVFGGVTVRLP